MLKFTFAKNIFNSGMAHLISINVIGCPVTLLLILRCIQINHGE